MISLAKLSSWERLVSNFLKLQKRIAAQEQLCTAEEGGSGKIMLLDKGAYKGMDACLMYVN